MLVAVRVETVTLVGAVGGWVSAQSLVVIDLVACPDELPELSRAVTATA
jgi:hypothetical protein